MMIERRCLYTIITIATHIIFHFSQYIIINLTDWTLKSFYMCWTVEYKHFEALWCYKLTANNSRSLRRKKLMALLFLFLFLSFPTMMLKVMQNCAWKVTFISPFRLTSYQSFITSARSSGGYFWPFPLWLLKCSTAFSQDITKGGLNINFCGRFSVMVTGQPSESKH